MGWYERAGRWAEMHRFAVDVVSTVVVGLPTVVASTALGTHGTLLGGNRTGAILLWSVLLVAALAWRRVRPVESTAAVAVVAVAHLVTGTPLILPADFAILVALYSVTVHGPVWAHRAALGTALAGAGLLGYYLLLHGADISTTSGIVVTSGVMALAAWSLGLVRRSRREMLDALRDRTRRLEIERDQQARIATAAERARIAREMHDIVAHSLSVVVAQADGGRYAASADPAAAGRALEVIAETGRAALADMRRLLGVLRSEVPRDSGGVRAPLAPQPGMSPGMSPGAPAGALPMIEPTETAPADVTPLPDDADLALLLGQARGAGMKVSFVRVGVPRRLPPGAGLTLHRVCQEALTNVRKHGGPDVSVTVVVRWGATAVELEVSDDGRGAAAADGSETSGSPGYGLLGMGERAALFGGKVTVGPRPGGGWRVRFTMPLPAGTKELA
ncbi:sensor histidine kinase [Xylanimonas sp. McL0601]|uniref:sensor histidine kinase n=1 Tax=Xylanimonas sp. McL0601 TaxID=3414739 RepID=UPI003CE69321